jgi:hypothetical protein
MTASEASLAFDPAAAATALEPTPTSESRLCPSVRSMWVPGFIGVIAAVASDVGFTLALIRPRFTLRVPSLVDDWVNRLAGPPAMHQLIHLHYDGHVEFARFRPAYGAVWNYLQWHTIGDSTTLAGAEFWNIVKIVLFMLALAVLTGAVVDMGASARRAVLLALPGIAVAATPHVAVDFARFGSGEPLMVAGLVPGMLLLIVALRLSLSWPNTSSSRIARAGAVLIAVAIGSLLYWFGVYTKEVSIGILVALPLIYRALDRRWSGAGLTHKALFRYRRTWAVGAIIVVPLLHVAFEAAKLGGNTTVYGAHPKSPVWDVFSVFRGFLASAGATGTVLWPFATLALCLLLVRQKRTVGSWPLIEVAVFVSGWAMTILNVIGGETASRYYIPALVGTAVTATAVLARQSPRVQLAAVGVVVAAALVSPAWRDVSRWTKNERQNEEIVGRVTGLGGAGCRIYFTNFDYERRLSAAFTIEQRTPREPACDKGVAAVVVNRSGEPVPRALQALCPRWEHPFRTAYVLTCHAALSRSALASVETYRMPVLRNLSDIVAKVLADQRRQ